MTPTDAALPHASMRDVAFDPRGVADFIAAQNHAGQDMTSLTIARGGTVCATAQWAPYTAADARQVYSVTKTYTSAAVGLAVDQGALSYDDLLMDLVADHVKPADVGPRAARIRVRDLLAMATGHTSELPLQPAELGLPWGECLRPLLIPEPAAELGTFMYNNLASYALAAIVQIATGRSCAEVLDNTLLGPLGIEAEWKRDRAGRPLGYAGLHIRPLDLAVLTQVVADGGTARTLGGRRLLPEQWHREATRVHADTTHLTDEGDDWHYGYGWQLWRSSHGYRLDGAYGQFGVIVPELDVVVVVTEGAMNTPHTLENIWRHLLPACDRPASADEEAVSATLAGQHFTGPGAPQRDPEAPLVADRTELALRDGVPTLRITDDACLTDAIPLGSGGEWIRTRLQWPEGSVEVAGSACVKHGELHGCLALLNQPHVVDLRADMGETPRLTEVRWRTSPLGTHHIRDLTLPDPTLKGATP